MITDNIGQVCYKQPAGVTSMEFPEPSPSLHQLIRQQVERIAADKDESHDDDGFAELVKTYGWRPCYDCLIEVLIDEHAGQALWNTSSALLWGGVLDKHPVDEDLLIGLVYKRLPPDEGSAENNLAWSIAAKLKKLDYVLSDYDPSRDPEVIAALQKHGLSLPAHANTAKPEGKPFLARLLERSDLVARVKVLKVPFWNKHAVRVEYLEIFKGVMPETDKVQIPTMWGKYASHWYKLHEQSVLFACGPGVISMGRAGRMPLVEIDGEVYAESFADSIDDLAGLEPINRNGRLLVRWGVLRAFLHEHGSRGITH